MPLDIAVRQAPFAQITANDKPLTTLTIVTQSPLAEIILMNQDLYDVGDTAEITAAFTLTRTKTLTDPGTLQIIVTNTSSATPTPVTYTYPCPQLVRDAVGQYRALLDCTASGSWQVYWIATGAAKCAKKMYFVVQ